MGAQSPGEKIKRKKNAALLFSCGIKISRRRYRNEFTGREIGA